MVKKLNNLIILAVCFLAGCSINYNDQSQDIKKSAEIPDSVMVDFNLIQIRNNIPYTEIIAEKAEIFDAQDKTFLLNAEFIEYDSKNKSVITKGLADKIEYYNDTENALLTGNINFYSKKEEIKMTGETLSWNSELKVIESKEFIQVEKEDGSTIEGIGFKANLKNSTFSFEKGVKGTTK